MWHLEGPQGKESQKIAPFIVPYCRGGRVLELGVGLEKSYPQHIGIDSLKDYGGRRPDSVDVVSDCTDLSLFADRSCAAVFSSHLLEHIEDSEAALLEWWRVVRPGGHLVLYLPHADLYPRMGTHGANPDHKRDFLPDDIVKAMLAVAERSGQPWTMLEDEVRDQGDGKEWPSEYSFFQVFRKETGPACEFKTWVKPEKAALVIRYGAIGDHLQASSVLPLLKEQGWHITFNTEPRGHEILRDNPNIDGFWLQDQNQVPNEWLGMYWSRLRERWDEVFNLTQSVEDTLLPAPGRLNYHWPDEVRRRVMGTVNYMERTHDLCAVPHRFDITFYPSAREKIEAKRRYDKISKHRRHPVILWALSGSSHHKRYFHMDEVIANLLRCTDARIVFTGDADCKILEGGWNVTAGQIKQLKAEGKWNERRYPQRARVFCRSGEWGIRETLAFARHADIVVGPETGVLNSVSTNEGVAKVIMLSHSSHENLTKHWVNTTVLEATKEAHCAACHRLHYDKTYCHTKRLTDEEGNAFDVALCVYYISPSVVFNAICDHIEAIGARRRAA